MSVTDGELTVLWRTEQVLHALARVMREKKLSTEVLGYEYLAVCECAEGVQGIAVRETRERLGMRAGEEGGEG